MEAPALRRPNIPLSFYQPSLLGTLGFISYALALFVIPGALTYSILRGVESLPLKILLLIPSIFVGGLGVHLLGWLGHDGTHLSLHPNKHLSVLIGLFFSSMAVTYFEMGFAFEHWNHHRFCNQPLDPDVRTLSRLKTWWQRILFTRLVYNTTYISILGRVILGRPLPFKYKLPFKDPTLKLFCWANIAFSLFWLGVYAWLTAYDFRIAIFCIGIPTLIALLASGPQSYIDHAGTLSDKTWENSRTRTSRLATLIWFGGNYHLEHHLYPGVPSYRLPAVHRHLKALGAFDKVNVEIDGSLFGAYRHLADNYSTTALEDVRFDPHHESIQGNYSEA